MFSAYLVVCFKTKLKRNCTLYNTINNTRTWKIRSARDPTETETDEKLKKKNSKEKRKLKNKIQKK